MQRGEGRGVANGLDRGRVDVVVGVDVDYRSASNTTSMSNARDNTINNK